MVGQACQPLAVGEGNSQPRLRTKGEAAKAALHMPTNAWTQAPSGAVVSQDWRTSFIEKD